MNNEIKLSDKQKQIITMLAQGKTEKEIASNLSIGHRAVQDHIKRVRKKLNCVNRVNVVAMCISNRIIEFTS